MSKVTEFLIKEIGMRVVYESRSENVNYNKFTCVLRIADVHYLFWSENYNHFSIGVKHEHPKGKSGGGIDYWTYVMIPKPIYTIEEAQQLINATVDQKMLKVICQ